MITQYGLPSAYLVAIETYEAQQKRMHLLEGIARGEKAIEEGRTMAHGQAKQRMAEVMDGASAKRAGCDRRLPCARQP